MRRELLYQSQSLAVGPSPCTGQHFTSGNSGQNLIRELFRIEKYGNNFPIPKRDVIQLGQYAAFARVQVDAPTPTWEIEYYTNNGVNEQRMGFPIDGVTPMLSGILANTLDDHNYFGLIVSEGTDAMGDNNTDTQYVECLGNGYVNSIKWRAAVGDFGMTTVGIEGSNYVLYSGSTGNSVPSIDPNVGTANTTWNFTFPEPAVSGDSPNMPTVLKYGDITMNLSGLNVGLGAIWTGTNAAHLQSFELTVPITREAILQLGNKFPYGRVARGPINAQLSITAILNELQTGSLLNLVNQCSVGEFAIGLNYNACSGSTYANVFNINIVGASLDSESFSIGVGQRKTVTANFTCPIGSWNDNNHQITLSGSHIGLLTGVL